MGIVLVASCDWFPVGWAHCVTKGLSGKEEKCTEKKEGMYYNDIWMQLDVTESSAYSFIS